MTAPSHKLPVIFIHGLWIHSEAWKPWLDLFASCGYPVSAPGWPGDGATAAETRKYADALNDVGIGQLTDHYAGLAAPRGRGPRPIVIGHSFGGLIAQLLLDRGIAAAAVAIDPAPIKGVKVLPWAQLRSGFPILGHPRTLHRTVSLTAKQFHYAFGNALSREESDALHAAYSISRTGQAAVRGCGGQLLPTRAQRCRHPQRRTRPAAAHVRKSGPRGSTKGHEGGSAALRKRSIGHRLSPLRRPWALPDNRQQMERGRRCHPAVAGRKGILRQRLFGVSCRNAAQRRRIRRAAHRQ